MSKPGFRQMAAFRMSFWNKQIGFEDREFGRSKGLIGRVPQKSDGQNSLLFTDF
jgi:hypothetical protein